MKIEVELTDEFIDSVLVTAFDGSYGGCWYWCRPFGWNWVTTDEEKLWLSCRVQDSEDDHVFTVDRAAVERGIKRILSGEVGIRSDLHAQVAESVSSGDPDIDADAADCIVQAGVLGKLVYG